MKLYQTTEFGVYNDKVVKCTIDCRLVYADGQAEAYFTVTGVAKCHEDDKFDEKLGKKIAEAKASKKAYETAIRHLERVKKVLLTTLMVTDEDIERADTMLMTEEKHLNNILKDVH